MQNMGRGLNTGCLLRIGVFTVSYTHLAEVFEYHRGYSKEQALEKTNLLLTSVGISDPLRRCNQYPHELSGGMRQRAMIAMALARCV